jgi:hypothetical protein
MNLFLKVDKNVKDENFKYVLNEINEAYKELKTLKTLPVHDGCKPYEKLCMNCQVGKCAFIGRLIQCTNATISTYYNSNILKGGHNINNKILLAKQLHKNATIKCLFLKENNFL